MANLQYEFTSFPYYNNQSQPRELCAKYHIQDNGYRVSSIVVRDDLAEHSQRYKLFKSAEDLRAYIFSLPEGQRCLHEVVDGTCEHLLAFDIDYPYTGDESDNSDKFYAALKNIVDHICEVLKAQHITINPATDITEYNSNRYDDETESGKLSVHLIVHLEMPDYTFAKEIAEAVYNCADEFEKSIIDMAFYKPTHNLRLPFCNKPGIANTKRIYRDSDYDTTIDFLLVQGPHTESYCEHQRYVYTKGKFIDALNEFNLYDRFINADEENTVLEDLYMIILDSRRQNQLNKRYELVNITQDQLAAVMAMTTDIRQCFTVLPDVNTWIQLRRNIPGHCFACNRRHESENAALFINGANVYFYCYRLRSKVLVGTLAAELAVKHITPNAENQPDRIQQYFDNAMAARSAIVPGDMPTVDTFNGDSNLLIKALLGSGKTQSLLAHIRANPTRYQRICILSFRCSFTSDINSKFADLEFKSYKDAPRGQLDANRIIVQVESLHKLKLVPFDLLIIDECESVINQFAHVKGMHGHLTENVAAFEWLLKYSGRVIAMDAFAGPRSEKVIGIPITEFTYSPHNKSVNIISGESSMNAMIINDLANDKRVVIPTNSKKYSEALARMIKELYPTKQVLLINSGSNEEDRDLSDVNKWANYDVLIYTGTVMAGISFEQTHFNKLYAYFTSGSSDVLSSIQMLCRVRTISEWNICIQANTSTLPVRVEDIEDYVCRADSEVMTGTYTLNKDATRVYPHKDLNYWISIYNMQCRHRSHNDFMGEFISTLALHVSAWNKAVLSPEAKPLIKNVQEIKSMVAKAITEESAERIASAVVISDEQASAISIKEVRTAAENDSLYRYNLMQIYKAPEITKEFVHQYGDRKAINTQNALRLYDAMPGMAPYSVKVTLELLRSNRMDTKEHATNSISRGIESDYGKHARVVGLMAALGFDTSKTSPSLAVGLGVSSKLESAHKYICDHIDDLVVKFGLQRTKGIDSYEQKKTIGMCNTILSYYDLKISESGRATIDGKRVRTYSFHTCNNFVYTQGKHKCKNMPLVIDNEPFFEM